MTNGHNAARARHLEELATAAKRYTLHEILDVTNAVATELENFTADVFTGAGVSSAGLSGLVPAPVAGEQARFLRGDGVWARPPQVGIDYIIGTEVQTIEGGLWQGMVDDSPVIKLRHGDYEFNFKYDDVTYLGSETTPVATVKPDTYVIGSESSTVDGGLWYELTNDVPTLHMRKGSFNYSFNYDTITYVGGNKNLVSFMPFTSSTTADACGNTWEIVGKPTIQNDMLYLDGSSCLVNDTIAESIGSSAWTVDFWATLTNPDAYNAIVKFHNENNNTREGVNGSWVSIFVCPFLQFAVGGSGENSAFTVSSATRHHYAMTFDGTTIRLFLDGVKGVEVAKNVQLARHIYLGASSGTTGSVSNAITGNVDHFRIFKGIALWTENFTPPTAADYT